MKKGKSKVLRTCFIKNSSRGESRALGMPYRQGQLQGQGMTHRKRKSKGGSSIKNEWWTWDNEVGTMSHALQDISISGLYPVDANASCPVVTTRNISSRCQMFPKKQKHSCLKTVLLEWSFWIKYLLVNIFSFISLILVLLDSSSFFSKVGFLIIFSPSRYALDTFSQSFPQNILMLPSLFNNHWAGFGIFCTDCYFF